VAEEGMYGDMSAYPARLGPLGTWASLADLDSPYTSPPRHWYYSVSGRLSTQAQYSSLDR
jgi:hypothetical protein